MGLPRTFVSFSSADIGMYNMVCAWKKQKHIDFNFTDCQLERAIESENEGYIKYKCRERVEMLGEFAMLIGKDTHGKSKCVHWEAEVALEKKCGIIGINLDGSRQLNPKLCPQVMCGVGAVFVPFRTRILAHTLESFIRQDSGGWSYPDAMYKKLGYEG